MDYDGSDNQGHKLKVASEGACKSPSISRSYDFPRFDSEDSLQGHLRFDSLVETDVFLGIQSQDDTQWIEDFSRGSDVINFSSSATESCSTARQNNVWYEATSSESVELLLKSVGQEQLPPIDTHSENFNNCNVLCSLTKEMEPKIEEDNVKSTRISSAIMLQDQQLNNVSELENCLEGKVSQVEENSLSHENFLQEDESAIQMCPNDHKEECKLPVTGVMPPDTECDDRDIQGAECPVDLRLNQTGDDLSRSAGPAQDINANFRSMVSSRLPDQISSHSEGTDAVTGATSGGIKEQKMNHAHNQIMEQQKLEDALRAGVPYTHSSAECVDKETAGKVIINPNESSMMSPALECQFDLLEGRGKNNSANSPTLLGRGQSQTDILSTDKFPRAASAVIDSSTDNSEQHSTKLSNPIFEHCSNSEANMDLVEESNQKLNSDEVDNMTESSHKGGLGNLVKESHSQSSLIEGEKVSSTVKISNANIFEPGESLVGPVSSSSVELTKETDGAESIMDLHVATAVNTAGSRSSGYREDLEVEADQQSNARGSNNISVLTKKEWSTSLPTCVIDAIPVTSAALNIDHGSSAQMSHVSHDEPVVGQQRSENAGEMGTANAITCKSNGSTVEGINKDIHKRVSDEVDSTYEAKSGIYHDSAAHSLSGTEGKLIPVSESCNIASGSKTPTLNFVDDTKRSQVHPGCDDSVLNKDHLKLECNSPTIISSVVLLPDETKQKGDIGSELAENKPSASDNLKGKGASMDDSSFTFKVNLPLIAEKEKANSWTPFPIADTFKPSVVLGGVTTPDTVKIQAISQQETSGSNPGDSTHGISKSTSGRKRRGSGKRVSKENLQEVNIRETTPDRPSHKEEKTSASFSSGGSLPGQVMGSQSHGLTKHKSKKQSSKNAVPTSKLPDLNASALKNNSVLSTAFHQPFTELQQLQLRAQIFVYGSLIQGTVPDEACMISAFGSSDGGRIVWEPVWQAALERAHSKKFKAGGESPSIFHSIGAKVPDLSVKQVSPESKVFPSSASRSSNMSTRTTTILSPIIPISSPPWSISTPYRDVSLSSSLQTRPILPYQPAISPRQPYHTPPLQNIIGHTARQSQASASPRPWVAQSSALHVNPRFSTTSMTETVKLTPAKDFPFIAPSYVKPIPAPTLYTDTTSTVSSRSSQLPDEIKGNVLSEVPSADSKPRRRNKAQPSAITAQNTVISQAQTETIVASSLPTHKAPPTPVGSHTVHIATSMIDVSSPYTTSQSRVCNLDAGKASCSEDILQKVEDARLKAEEAAAFAATAISHCENLWSQLAKQDSKIAQEAETQIAAAAGAAAAAASVAKAAAAAARVASNAALQAKLMADEAFSSTALRSVAQSRNLSNVQSVGSAQSSKQKSIIASEHGANRCSSILFGAKEAAKGKQQAASAAAKQAENIDSILEAAKLAAKAVYQAGKVVAMGEPLPLKELISLGPEWYWKLPQASSELIIKSGNGKGEQTNIGCAEVAKTALREFGGLPGSKILEHGRILMQNPSNDLSVGNIRSVSSISESASVDGKDPGGGNNLKVSYVLQSNRGPSVLESGSRTINVLDQRELGVDQVSNIKEGSIVEVYKDGDGLKPAWLLANVLTLHGGKALVEYTGILSTEGSGKRKEWVALEGEDDKAPRIRGSLPMTASHSQGTMKRRRSECGDNAWTVGDRVDVWIQNSWYEGIVTERNEKDDTTLTVHFPARGETSAVSSQQLRSSRIWTDGSWVQCSRLRGHDYSYESDMPPEKRPRLKSPNENKSEGAEPVVRKPEESKLQALFGSDMVFNVGKNSKADTKPDARQKLNSGSQREGSRVAIGAPKPGKKRKFVEVSKHFPANQNGTNSEPKDQVKFAKYLMPHRTDSRGGKNLSKVDSKEKQSLRNTSRSSSSRTVPQRDNVANPASSHSDEAMPLSGSDVEKSVVHEEDASKTAAMTDRGSSGAYEARKGLLGSSLKKSSSSNKPDLPNKGNLAPAGGKLTKADEKDACKDKTDSTQAELSEPRRSNRRIQPTHRLLEGLQSSLIIPNSKMTSAPPDKAQFQKSRGK